MKAAEQTAEASSADFVCNEPIRIEFAPDTTSATVGETIKKQTGFSQTYVFEAKKGQLLFVDLKYKLNVENIALYPVIKWANGEELTVPDGSLDNQVIPADGDSFITVQEEGVMGSPQISGDFQLTLTIEYQGGMDAG